MTHAYAYGHAKRMAVLALAAAAVGCRPPCKVVAAETIAFTQQCSSLAKERKDVALAAACVVSYEVVSAALAGGTCSNEVSK